MNRYLVLLALLLASVVPCIAQRPDRMPRVSSWDVPFYPPLARAANVEGVVRLRVITDGERVQKVETLEGHPLLAQAAAKNVQSWRFISGSATTLTVMFSFKLAKSDSTNLQRLEAMYPDVEIHAELPLVVELTSAPIPPLD